MPDDFLVARNPEPDSTLPYLLRIPVGGGIVLKARESWPRTAKVYCHRSDAWPDDPDIIERVPTRAATKRGAAIDLVLDRGRENRSQFVLTYVRGREAIFWQTARTAKQARPTARRPAPALRDAPRSPSRSTATSATHGSSPTSRSRPPSRPWPRVTTASTTADASSPASSASRSPTS